MALAVRAGCRVTKPSDPIRGEQENRGVKSAGSAGSADPADAPPEPGYTDRACVIQAPEPGRLCHSALSSFHHHH